MPVTDLRPLALPESQQSRRMTSFPILCAICSDVPENPVVCESCSTRFCRDCLNSSHSATGDETQEACPNCSSDFTGIGPDNALVQCPYESCLVNGTGMISLSRLRAHRNFCQAVKVSCAYEPYGCVWTGCRSDVKQREAQSCNFAKLLDDHRIKLDNLQRQLRDKDNCLISVTLTKMRPICLF